MIKCIECHEDIGDSTSERIYFDPDDPREFPEASKSLGPICRECAGGRPFPLCAQYLLLIEFGPDESGNPRRKVYARARVLSQDGKYGLEDGETIEVTRPFRELVDRLDLSALIRGEEVMR